MLEFFLQGGNNPSTFHHNPFFESQMFNLLIQQRNMTLILHFAVCKITISLGSAVLVPGAVQPERMIQTERERERGEVSTSKARKETVAAVSNTVALCISIFHLMSISLGLSR